MKKILLSAACLACLLACSKPTDKTIASIEAISVETPEGTVPRLPYQVWTTYRDGTTEYRQVKWMNADLDTEEALADASLHPVGSTYTVEGFILGNDSTAQGYPLTATVQVCAQPSPAPAKPIAEPLPLNKVKLTGDNRLTWNRNLDIQEMLTWDVSQYLYNYRDTYGLSTEGYAEPEGWDSPTTKLKGHGTGHFLSALAFAYAGCEDNAQRALLLDKISRMVNEMRQCQERTFVFDQQLGRYREARDLAPEAELRTLQGTWADFDRYKQDYAHYGYGYLNAIPAQHVALVEMYRPYHNDNWVWAPYYVIHKQLAGLIDIATYVDQPDIAAKALLIAKDMGLWVWNRLHYRTFVQADGTQEQRRAKPGNRYEMWNMYIAGEVGGMSESLARLAQLVSDEEEQAHLAEAANFFDSPAFFSPLMRNIDAIRTRHANQHIPMITGALRNYRNNGNPAYYRMAVNFWHLIQGRYRYATGGVGNAEMFRQPYTQLQSMATNTQQQADGSLLPDPDINETCCAYNLAKLTKDLNCFDPDNAAYMDYYERVLYNQLVGSLNPHRYQTTYHYAVGLNASKAWGNETPQISCCGGTGAENHVKYQEAAYFANDSTLWVALYLPTQATWDAQGITLSQECAWPAEQSVIRILQGSGRFAMKLRVPAWATRGFSIQLNGRPVAATYQPSSYVTIPTRQWSEQDVVTISMPFSPHLDYAPDKLQEAAVASGGQQHFSPLWAGAIMLGPLVMASTGFDTWEEATLTLRPDLGDVQVNPVQAGTGADANLRTLTLQGHTFYPDYYLDEQVTHYFRLFTENTDLTENTDENGSGGSQSGGSQSGSGSTQSGGDNSGSGNSGSGNQGGNSGGGGDDSEGFDN